MVRVSVIDRQETGVDGAVWCEEDEFFAAQSRDEAEWERELVVPPIPEWLKRPGSGGDVG